MSSASTCTPAQSAALSALAAGATITAAAQMAGVHRSSVHNWLKNASFETQFQAARQEYTDTLRDQLAELSALALYQLRVLIDHPNTPASVRLRAITFVLTRPAYPKPGWSLPISVNTPAEDSYMRKVAELGLELQSYRHADNLMKTVGEALAAKQAAAQSTQQDATEFDTSTDLDNDPGSEQPEEHATDFDTFSDLSSCHSSEARKAATPVATPVAPSRFATCYTTPQPKRPARNEPCPCGSRMKYKKCCGK